MNQIPTFRELLTEYPRIAAMERAKCERPSKTTVMNALVGVRAILPEGWLDRSIVDLTRRRIDEYLVVAPSMGHSAVTAWSYVLQLRAVTARWTRPYYEERGWIVPPFDIPVCRRRGLRYIRPDSQILHRVKAWYETLDLRDDRRDWLVATLMLEFAMRNGDIARLTWNEFHERVEPPHMVLLYTPHKTELSSGRIVCWPVHDEIWSKMCQGRLRGENIDFVGRTRRRGRPPKSMNANLVVPRACEVFKRLNNELRALGIFHGSKALYELRKICVDHIYQRFGAEMASSISGDDIRTVTRYYADPSAVNVVGVRIVDLL